MLIRLSLATERTMLPKIRVLLGTPIVCTVMTLSSCIADNPPSEVGFIPIADNALDTAVYHHQNPWLTDKK